jgi:hypothetical protein
VRLFALTVALSLAAFAAASAQTATPDSENGLRFEMSARSLRISNRKLPEECAGVPKYPSVREGWSTDAAAIPAVEWRR